MRNRATKSALLIVALILSSVEGRADALVESWSRRFGDASFLQIGIGAATDASGNVIICGYFTGTVNFGGSDLTSTGGSNDIFVAKFNSSGAHQWSQRFGDIGDDIAYAVTADPSGNVYVTGWFAGTVNFGGGGVAALGPLDAFLVKLNSAGLHQYTKRFGDVGSDYGSALDTDASGNVYAAGKFNGLVNFGGLPLASTGNDIYLVKFNSAGAHQWSQRFGDAADQTAWFLSVDGASSVIATGEFEGTINFGGPNLTSLGERDIFLAKFNTGGLHQWSQRFGDAATQIAYAVATDGANNVIMAGAILGTTNFGGVPLTSAGSSDMFVAKFNSNGLHQWSRRFGDGAEQIASGLAVDPSGNVIVAGTAEGAVNFGGRNLVAVDAHDFCVATLSPTGIHQWSQRFGDAGDQLQATLACDGNGNVAMAGQFGGSVNFGEGDLQSAGGYDIYVARFGNVPLVPAITSILDIGNDQGRMVKVRFNRSGFDDEVSPFPVVRYDAFRRDDPPPAGAAGDPATMTVRELLINGWTQVGTVTAYGDDTYGIDAPTIGDSTVANGQYLSTFLIRAGTNEPTRYYDSASAAGYSLDNLAPGAPSLLVYQSGQLSWGDPTDEDFDYFSVYGGNTSSFGSAIFIGYTTNVSMDVGASPYAYYFVTATDFAGNESNPASTNVVTGAEGPPDSYVLSVSAYPNPFNPQTTIRYTLPSRGRVEVSIFDLRGARVTTLVDNEMDNGAYTETWNGANSTGERVSSGIYFARIKHANATRTYKLVLLK